MRKKTAAILCVVCIFAVNGFVRGENADEPRSTITTDVVTISVEQQYEFVQPGSESALAVHFELKKDWHFYASAKTAPGGMNLKLKPSFPSYINFSEPIFPQPHLYFDKSLGKKLEVFSDKFTAFLPFTVSQDMPKTEGTWNTLVPIKIDGAVCSGVQCRMPDFGNLGTVIKIALGATMGEPKFTLPEAVESVQRDEVVFLDEQLNYPMWFALVLGYPMWFALVLALLAGLGLNLMPCVWPVLPLVVLRLVEQAKKSKGRTVAIGLAFSFGILLFFACLAGANIVLRLIYGTALQWGDQFRNPAFVTGMALLMVVLALFMFDVFTITLPALVTGKSSSGRGYVGTIGMGFLAAILSTPCSFGILAAVFAWAQGQSLLPATIVIMFIGIGMGAPYLILTSIPGLLEKLPKPGRWMEIFKQMVGFILLGIAVWMITVVPQEKRASVLYFAVVLAFCVWMWGGWVSYNTKALQKWLVRIIAVVLAVFAGWGFLKPAEKLIDWQSYDSAAIESALSDQRPLLIKFTADWCLSCKTVDRLVYSRKDIANLIKQKNVLAVKADTTARYYPATQALRNVYKEPGVPVSMYFAPGQKEPVRWRDKSFADELKALLEELNTEDGTPSPERE